MEDKKKHLLIIDANSIIHRAYHALPPLATKKGELVNAIYGFLLVFLKAIRDFQPDFIAAAFDFPAPTFRHKKYQEYKAKRPPTPEELYQQIPKVKEVLKGFNVAVFEKSGFEADDLIGTLAIKSQKLETIIISGDLDTLQLVNPHTKVYFLRRGVKDIVLYDENLVKEKYGGLESEQLLDFKALKGDPSDNIPGVAGIGEKTAIELIKEFGSLENLYQNLERNREKAKKIRPKLRESLNQSKDQVFLNKVLLKIETNVAIDFSLNKIKWQGYNKKKAEEILKELEFYSLLERLSEKREMKLF